MKKSLFGKKAKPKKERRSFVDFRKALHNFSYRGSIALMSAKTRIAKKFIQGFKPIRLSDEFSVEISRGHFGGAAAISIVSDFVPIFSANIGFANMQYRGNKENRANFCIVSLYDVLGPEGKGTQAKLDVLLGEKAEAFLLRQVINHAKKMRLDGVMFLKPKSDPNMQFFLPKFADSFNKEYSAIARRFGFAEYVDLADYFTDYSDPKFDLIELSLVHFLRKSFFWLDFRKNKQVKKGSGKKKFPDEQWI